MLNFFSKFLDANQKEINRLSVIVDKINGLEPQIKKYSDKKLKEESLKLKKQVQEGEKLNNILPQAYALLREALRRVEGARLFDVQLMAAIALHEGKIAEQRTGEGKTFTAAAALYLNALEGKGVHLVTVNDFLARLHAGWLGPVYNALGLTSAAIIHDESFIYDPSPQDTSHGDKRLWNLRKISRQEAYNADITYGTNNEFGFDYLRDNMQLSLANLAQRGHHFAIVDEVDSILIDEARTPLIISAPGDEPTEKYLKFSSLINKLSADSDYVIDEKLRTAHLSEAGTLKIEKLLGVNNLYEQDFSSLHHIEEALKARTLFQKDKDYVVKDGEVIIVDEFTGRLMPGRRYSEGLHQAIEAKEGVPIQQESKTMATISFQNYFRMYQKLAGMTGTAATEAEEFHKIYKLDVLVIPTNKPIQRQDLADSIYKTQSAKYSAVAEEIEKLHKSGQPVLVGTTSIEKNEFLSALLKKKKISHALLNAKNHEKEAEIIAKAGQKGAVTVATNMAGRGVDIRLGEGVAELGGLYVLGTERHESRRIDNQLRGRSGRQGDPGVSKFFVSLEDDLMRIFGGDQVARVMTMLKMPENMPIEHGLVSRAIEGAQKKVEGHNFDIRKHTVEYDDVMNQQRQIIYGVRRQILESFEASKNGKGGSEKSLKKDILEKVAAEIEKFVSALTQEGIDSEGIVNAFSAIIPLDPGSQTRLKKEVESLGSSSEISDSLIKTANHLYEIREKQIGEEAARQIEGMVYLQTLDNLWVEHLDTIDDLRVGIGLRGYAQRDPLVEYKKEAFDLFEKLIASIDSEVVHRIYKVTLNQAPPIQVRPADLREEHEEALDEKALLEEAGQLITGPDKIKVKEDRVIPDLPYSGTKVTVERGGQVVSQNVYGESGNISKAHGKIGRNDPCWCGSGKKYKRCHYPN